MTSDDRQALIRAHLEGTASDEQTLALDRLLREDPGMRQALLAEAAFDERLRRIVGRQGERAAAADVRAAQSDVTRTMPSRAFWIPLAAAASLLLAVGAVWYSVWSGPAARKADALPVQAVPATAQTQARAPETPAVRLATVVGNVTLVRGSAGRRPRGSQESSVLAEQSAICAGDVLDVASNAQIHVQYADGSRLILYGGSRVGFDTSDGAKRLEVHYGALDADMVRQPTNQLATVQTRRMLAEVRGTQFRAIEDGAASWLAVRSGNVRVRRDVDGKRVDLSKGRYVVVHPSAPFGPIPAAQCPYWRSRCRLSVGDQYP